MGVSEPQGDPLQEEDCHVPVDKRPTKSFRPFLKSDPRNAVVDVNNLATTLRISLQLKHESRKVVLLRQAEVEGPVTDLNNNASSAVSKNFKPQANGLEKKQLQSRVKSPLYRRKQDTKEPSAAGGVLSSTQSCSRPKQTLSPTAAPWPAPSLKAHAEVSHGLSESRSWFDKKQPNRCASPPQSGKISLCNPEGHECCHKQNSVKRKERKSLNVRLGPNGPFDQKTEIGQDSDSGIEASPLKPSCSELEMSANFDAAVATSTCHEVSDTPSTEQIMRSPTQVEDKCEAQAEVVPTIIMNEEDENSVAEELDTIQCDSAVLPEENVTPLTIDIPFIPCPENLRALKRPSSGTCTIPDHSSANSSSGSSLVSPSVRSPGANSESPFSPQSNSNSSSSSAEMCIAPKQAKVDFNSSVTRTFEPAPRSARKTPAFQNDSGRGSSVANWRPKAENVNHTQDSHLETRRKSASPNWRSNYGRSTVASESSSMVDFGLPTSFGTSKKQEALMDTPDVDELVEDYFSKKFSFSSDKWELPELSSLFTCAAWELHTFIELKRKLNSVKDKLNDLNLQDWHAHTRRRNRAGNIMWNLRKNINPEFPSQAWCKFYENACSFPLVPRKAIESNSLKSVHLCEAPGAFVTSLNHFLRSNYNNIKWDWRATTLNPYYEGNPLSSMINDDRLILATMSHWCFGEDNTGNLMKPENLAHLEKEASKMGDVLLVTADGSIDCQGDPAEQEMATSWLHYCETVAALRLLAPGGSFLIKMFTFYEHPTICLMYLLNCVFKTVSVNKPATSKEGNSEVYVVCCDYVGKERISPFLDSLMSHYGPKGLPSEAMFPIQSIPQDFLEQLYNCANFFRKLQTEIMEGNIRTFKASSKRDVFVTAAMRFKVQETFFRRYNLRKSDPQYWVQRRGDTEAKQLNLDPRMESGSFNDKRRRMAMCPEEKVKVLSEDLRYMNVRWPGDNDVFWIEFGEVVKEFKITRGEQITRVNSSKFCLGQLLKLRNEVRDLALNHFKMEPSQPHLTRNRRIFEWPNPIQGERQLRVIDFKDSLWISLEDGSYPQNEKASFKKLVSVIDNMWRGDCLEVHGFPLLTQFNVGVVYVLGHLFDQVGLVKPEGQDIRILFYNFRQWNPNMERLWNTVIQEMENGAVLSVVPISELAVGDFYRFVTEINNLCVKEQIEDILKNLPVKV